MPGATLLGRGGAGLRPCILWIDTRSHEQAAALAGDPRFRATTGNIVSPRFTAPTLAWIPAKYSGISARSHMVILPSASLRHWLTGELISEMSDASGTSWLDVGGRAWSEELLEATGLGLSHMPALVEGTQEAGRLRGNLAARWGMSGQVVVAGGAGDN